MGDTYSCRTFLSKISTSQTCTTTPSTHLTPTTLTTHSIPLTPNTPPPTSLPPTPPQQTLPPCLLPVPHPKKCDTKKCDPLSNLHNKMGHTYSCRTFLSKISTSQTCTMNGSHLFMSHFLSKIYNNIIVVKP